MENVRKLFSLIRNYWLYAGLNIFFNILSILFSLISLSLIIPFLNLLFDRNKLVTNLVEWNFSVESLTHNFYFYLSKVIIDYGKPQALVFISLLVLLLFLIRNLTRYLAMYLIAPLRNGVTRDLRNKVFRHLLILPIGYFTGQRKGDIMARMANDVPEVEWSIMNTLMMLFKEPFAILLYFGTMMLISVKLSLLLLVSLPLAGWLISLIGKQLNSISHKGQKKLGSLVSVIEESMHGLKIIKAFNAIGHMNAKFSSLNQNYTHLMNKIYRRRDLSNPLTEVLAILVMVVIIWVGGRMVLFQKEGMSSEMFLFYLAIFSQLIPPAKNLITAYYYIEKGLASLERVEEILKADEVIIQKNNALSINNLVDKIVFDRVSFRYDQEWVLRDISFSIRKGQKIALVGPSGGGKSTLVDLLVRFYDCTEGEIRIDGVPVNDCRIDDLRALSAMVTQECILFNDTVYNNIVFGLENPDENAVKEAARMANAHNFIMEMPDQYQTLIGDRGVKLSGGQKQRLSIARAILRNPPVLIMDEATSALDTESEKLVQQALDQALTGRTSIIIAHRLSTVINADLILVLDKGRLVQQGTHQELMAQDGLYHDLYFAQLKPESGILEQ